MRKFDHALWRKQLRRAHHALHTTVLAHVLNPAATALRSCAYAWLRRLPYGSSIMPHGGRT
jgi:hypothetical protein